MLAIYSPSAGSSSIRGLFDIERLIVEAMSELDTQDGRSNLQQQRNYPIT